VWVDKYSNTSHCGRGFSNKVFVTLKPIFFILVPLDGHFMLEFAGSILGGVIGIFRLFHSSNSISPGSAQPRTEMSTRNIFWGVKVAGVTALPSYVSIVWKPRSRNYLKHSGRVQTPTAAALPKPEGRRFN
jgi:hypothetical protein